MCFGNCLLYGTLEVFVLKELKSPIGEESCVGGESPHQGMKSSEDYLNLHSMLAFLEPGARSHVIGDISQKG